MVNKEIDGGCVMLVRTIIYDAKRVQKSTFEGTKGPSICMSNQLNGSISHKAVVFRSWATSNRQQTAGDKQQATISNRAIHEYRYPGTCNALGDVFELYIFLYITCKHEW